MSFTWVDWAILAIIAISALISISRGFFREALSLATWIAAVIIAWTFGGSLSLMFTHYIEIPSVRIIAACVLLFIATLMVGAMINHLIAELVKMTGLSGTDRALGMAFGACRGILIVVVLVGLVGFSPVQNDSWWQQSRLIPHFQILAEWSKRSVMQVVGPFLNSSS
ncbi:CvpA family protein [Aestuariirhabdus litorea]|uniref:CvpA family protein n=1 Tax=Aestuariirhabdus litorea TaxID=2528527 RepID=A0A3P3VSH0_9GAMM|nr:CvpA family protein [Aestuariirhabdus litorea]RRJ84918.1 CvpA family protein [Aestuariirhabdus litorea]RWW98143.1 CvpA family protein [Endozoicomonadaceae bacterium GTF-13]